MKAIVSIFLIIFNFTASAQSLKDYLQIAAENNPGVKAAHAEFEAAMQKAPQVGGLPDPTLTASRSIGGMETLMGQKEASFELMQMFPWFGTLGKKEDAAALLAEARFQQYVNVKKQLSYEVKSLYAELYVASEIVEIQEENFKILNSYRDLALSGFQSGNAAMADVLKVELKIEAASTEIELLREQLNSLKVRFNALLNRAPEAPIAIQDTLVFGENGTLVDKKPVFEKHPTVLQFKKQEESYTIQQEVARKTGMPMLGIGLDYTIISKSPMAMHDMNGDDMIMPMLSISLPIFGKKYKAKQKEAELMAEGMQAKQEKQKNTLSSEYARALFEFKKAKKLIDLYGRQIKTALQANKLLVSGFSNATEAFEEILQMNQDILMFKIERFRALKGKLTAQAKLEYLLSK